MDHIERMSDPRFVKIYSENPGGRSLSLLTEAPSASLRGLPRRHWLEDMECDLSSVDVGDVRLHGQMEGHLIEDQGPSWAAAQGVSK